MNLFKKTASKKKLTCHSISLVIFTLITFFGFSNILLAEGCNITVVVKNDFKGIDVPKELMTIKKISYKRRTSLWDQMWTGSNKLKYNETFSKSERNFLFTCDQKMKIKVKMKCQNGDIKIFKTPVIQSSTAYVGHIKVSLNIFNCDTKFRMFSWE